MKTKRRDRLAWATVGAVALLVAGCQTTSEELPAEPPTEQIVGVSGTDLDQENAEKVRASETLRAYPVGRYIDPNDSGVMHEAHVIYRKEVGAGWNLHPNAPTVVPLGPVLAVADPARQPDPLPAELEYEMAVQNQLMAALIEQNEALAAELAKLSKELTELREKAVDGLEEDEP